jgi:uncharacterized protein (DUF2062 family)
VKGWRKIREKLREELHEETEPHAIAGGFAVGVFISLTPLVFLHTALALLAALVFRFSKIAAVAGAWVNNPYVMPFVFYACFRLGERMLGLRVPAPGFDDLSIGTIMRAGRPYLAPLFLGTTVTGIAAAAVSYVVVLRIAMRVKSARREAGRKEGLS